MRLLLYGGTFDPPHNGHLNNLRAAAARVRPDMAIVMPAGVPPHKHASTTPGHLRLEMCACFKALAGQPGACVPELEVSGWEIEQAAQGKSNYTLLTLQMLAAKYQGAELFLAMGSDMLLTFDKWHCWQDILALARLVVVSRNTGDDERLRQKAEQLDHGGGRILLAQTEALPMASSALRARIASGDECAAELPENVRQIIKREKLYQEER